MKTSIKAVNGQSFSMVSILRKLLRRFIRIFTRLNIEGCVNGNESHTITANTKLASDNFQSGVQMHNYELLCRVH